MTMENRHRTNSNIHIRNNQPRMNPSHSANNLRALNNQANLIIPQPQISERQIQRGLPQALSPIQLSKGSSLIDSQISQQNGPHILPSTSSHEIISNLGLNDDSNMDKSRRNRIFPDAIDIQFKLPELSQYYFKKTSEITLAMINNLTESHGQENKGNNSTNNFFDLMNHTQRPDITINTKNQQNATKDLKGIGAEINSNQGNGSQEGIKQSGKQPKKELEDGRKNWIYVFLIGVLFATFFLAVIQKWV